jgi:putative membrane protein
MKVTSHVLTVAATALLAATVWAQNSSSSQTPQIRPEAQPPYSPGGARTPGIDPSSSQTPPMRPEAQPPYSPGSARTPGVNPSDTTEGQTQPAMDPMVSARKFVKEAAQGSATEIALGKLAQEKGSSDAVKQFGKRMVEDHSKATEELKQAAEMAKIPIPSEPPKKAKKTQDKLSKLSGADFDRAYAKTMLSDHKEDVKAFEKEARDGAVPPVKDFAAKTLPTLQEHLKLAEELDAAAGKASETSR